MTLPQILDGWHAFFHEPVPCSTLAVFRILLGLILVANSLLIVPLIDDYYSADGVWSLAAWQRCGGRQRFSLLHLLPPVTAAFRLLWAVHFLACVAFLVGWQFRISSVVVFLTLVSIHHRNTYVLSSGDTLLRLFTFLAMFSDAAAALSADACLSGSAASRFPPVDPWPVRVMQLQLCIVYVRTVYWKLRGRMWWDGTAAWYPLWVDAYVRFRPPQWMLTTWLIRTATWGTLTAEAALGSLIWVQEFRYPVLCAGIIMHLVFDVIMNLQFFSWIMISGLLLFVCPHDMQQWLQLAV